MRDNVLLRIALSLSATRLGLLVTTAALVMAVERRVGGTDRLEQPKRRAASLPVGQHDDARHAIDGFASSSSVAHRERQHAAERDRLLVDIEREAPRDRRELGTACGRGSSRPARSRARIATCSAWYGQGDIVSGYTRATWAALCAEVAKLTVSILDGSCSSLLHTLHQRKYRNRWTNVVGVVGIEPTTCTV